MKKILNSSSIFAGLVAIALFMTAITAYQTVKIAFYPVLQVAQVTGMGLQYSVDNTGIQTLWYNGVKFTDPDSPTYPVQPNVYGAYYNDKNAGGVFMTPTGATTSVSAQIGSSQSSSGSSVCPVAKTNAQCVKHVFFPGQKDSYTLVEELSTYDSRTAVLDFYITNNDSTDTMQSFNTEYLLGTGMNTPDLAANRYYGSFAVSPESPVAFIPGATWGSVALFTDNYTQNVSFSTRNTYDTSGNSTPPTNVQYYWDIKVNENIAPGATYHYSLNIRFGATTDTAKTLAPEAFTSYAASNPYMVNWSDRRPIGRWFIAEGNHTSSTNPRGYLWDSSINVSNQSDFSSRVLSQTDSIITRMNSMDPKPQGIIIWDLEGEEFGQYFTYVGYPNKLHDMAPEMDAVADQMFSKFKNAGYKIGITLRPQDFQTGTKANMPTTCSGGNSNVDLNDIYIATDATYPNRGYECASQNTWQNRDHTGIYHQHSPQDDATLLKNLESKIDYAYGRWGTTMYYVDSTVYSNNGGGNPIDASVFSDLMNYLNNKYAGVSFIVFPENENTNYFRSTAPYNQADMGVYDTSSDAKYIWPQAFSIIAHLDSDGTNLLNPSLSSQYVQSLKNGNIFFYENIWFMADTAVEGLYQQAGITNASLGTGTSTSTTTPVDTTPPSVSVTAPTSGSTVSGTVTLTASAIDNVAVANVQFMIDGSKIGNVVYTSPYTYALNTTSYADGSHTISASAVDTSGNTANSQPITINISNAPATDSEPPSAPANLTASAVDSSTVNMSWSPSVDNVGVTGYIVYRNGSVIATSPSSTYSDYNVTAGASYTYAVAAADAAGNISAKSNSVSVTVPTPPPSNPPVSITSYSVSSKSGTSATVTWTTNVPSTGVVTYGTSANQLTSSISDTVQVTSSSGYATQSTSHTVTIINLNTKTKYYYKISAKDSVSNTSDMTPMSNFRTPAH